MFVQGQEMPEADVLTQLEQRYRLQCIMIFYMHYTCPHAKTQDASEVLFSSDEQCLLAAGQKQAN